jgi:DNA (cytosine-5)-methyltransferase 1
MGSHSPSRPVAIDLFCGAGGLTHGLKAAGFHVLSAVELDPIACESYRLNHKEVRLIEGDISKVTARTLLPRRTNKRTRLDLLAACPPCQGFSAIRTRNGGQRVRDKQNDLIFEVLRLTRSLNPRTVMLENVPGLVRNKRFKLFVKGLNRAGYYVVWDVLNTKDYGVPQSRRRLILLAAKEQAPSFARPAKSKPTVGRAISYLPRPSASRDKLHNYQQDRSAAVKRRIAAVPKNGGSRDSFKKQLQLACHDGFDGFRDVYGRMAWDRPAPTITGGCINPSKGRFIHPSQNRAITIREAALLQTFPRSYRFPIEKGRYAMALLIGNALPPEFIRRQAVQLKKSLTHAK